MATIARGAKAGGGTNFNSGQTIDPAEVNDDLNTLYTEVNANLDDGNIETATIPGAKSLRFTEISTPSTPSSNDLLLYAKDYGGVSSVLYTVDAAGTEQALNQARFAGTGGKVALIGGVIDGDEASVGTAADTSELVLHSHAIAVNTLSSVGMAIHITANGLLAANANNKTVNLRLNGVAGAILVGTGVVATNSAMWDLDVWVVRSGTNTVDAHGVIRVGAAGGAVGAVSVHRHAYAVDAAITLTSAWTLDICGLNGTASANDVTCRFSRSIWYPVV